MSSDRETRSAAATSRKRRAKDQGQGAASKRPRTAAAKAKDEKKAQGEKKTPQQQQGGRRDSKGDDDDDDDDDDDKASAQMRRTSSESFETSLMYKRGEFIKLQHRTDDGHPEITLVKSYWGRGTGITAGWLIDDEFIAHVCVDRTLQAAKVAAASAAAASETKEGNETDAATAAKVLQRAIDDRDDFVVLCGQQYSGYRAEYLALYGTSPSCIDRLSKNSFQIYVFDKTTAVMKNYVFCDRHPYVSLTEPARWKTASDEEVERKAAWKCFTQLGMPDLSDLHRCPICSQGVPFATVVLTDRDGCMRKHMEMHRQEAETSRCEFRIKEAERKIGRKMTETEVARYREDNKMDMRTYYQDWLYWDLAEDHYQRDILAKQILCPSNNGLPGICGDGTDVIVRDGKVLDRLGDFMSQMRQDLIALCVLTEGTPARAWADKWSTPSMCDKMFRENPSYRRITIVYDLFEAAFNDCKNVTACEATVEDTLNWGVAGIDTTNKLFMLECLHYFLGPIAGDLPLALGSVRATELESMLGLYCFKHGEDFELKTLRTPPKSSSSSSASAGEERKETTGDESETDGGDETLPSFGGWLSGAMAEEKAWNKLAPAIVPGITSTTCAWCNYRIKTLGHSAEAVTKDCTGCKWTRLEFRARERRVAEEAKA